MRKKYLLAVIQSEQKEIKTILIWSIQLNNGEYANLGPMNQHPTRAQVPPSTCTTPEPAKSAYLKVYTE